MANEALTTDLKAAAQRLGFALAGVCAAVEPAGIGRFGEWLAAGYAGEMHYLAGRAEAYTHPRHVLDGVRSLLVLGFPYRTSEPAPSQPTHGRVARYAWGEDYHEVLWRKLKELETFLLARAPHAAVRTVVDTAPLLEREFAVLAGLGWIGKNTLLLNKHEGSYFFLAALLTDVDLGAPLGATATLVQLSSPGCATCPQVRRVLAALAAERPGVVHVEIDATRRIDLARRLNVLRTPTVLVLGPRGELRTRTSGPLEAATAARALDAHDPLETLEPTGA